MDELTAGDAHLAEYLAQAEKLDGRRALPEIKVKRTQDSWAKGWTEPLTTEEEVIEIVRGAAPDPERVSTAFVEAIVWNHKYDAGKPIDISKIQEATQLIIENPSTDAVVLSDGLLKFVKEHERVKGWSSPEEADATGLMVDAWTAREVEFGEKTASGIASCRSTGHTLISKKDDEDKAQDPPISFDVDEADLPYSAWALRQNTEIRLLAAVRYMEELSLQGKDLSEDAMLETAAKTEALSLLSVGRQHQEIIGNQFMNQYYLLKMQAESRMKQKSSKDGNESRSDEGYDSPDFWVGDEGEEEDEE